MLQSKICFLILYVDDILLATDDMGTLYEVKQFLSKNFEIKDIDEGSYVIGIKIHRERFQGILVVSRDLYQQSPKEISDEKKFSPCPTPIMKGDKFSLDHSPKNDLEQEHMRDIPYASAVGSLMYA